MTYDEESARYIAHPDSNLLALVDKDFSTDSFFTDSSTPAVEPTFGCNQQPTHVIQIDLDRKAFKEVEQRCEGSSFEGMDFCASDSEVQEEKFFETCSDHFDSEGDKEEQ